MLTVQYVTNQADMVRWANTRHAATWSQLVINPLTVTISSTLGILATAAINNTWDLDLWNQWDLMNAILDRYSSAGARCGVALCSFCWLFYILGINIVSLHVSYHLAPLNIYRTSLFYPIPGGELRYPFYCCITDMFPTGRKYASVRL